MFWKLSVSVNVHDAEGPEPGPPEPVAPPLPVPPLVAPPHESAKNRLSNVSLRKVFPPALEQTHCRLTTSYSPTGHGIFPRLLALRSVLCYRLYYHGKTSRSDDQAQYFD